MTLTPAARRIPARAALALGSLTVLAACGDTDPRTASDPAAPATSAAPPASALPAGTHLGPVEISTDDLPGLTDFYTAGVGLEVVDRNADSRTLGSGDVEVLRLVRGDAPADDQTTAGLYHSAFLYDDATELAAALVRSAQHPGGTFQGSADHRVSQAFYLADPDGNGVELYVDRPREQWEWTTDGVTMGSEALDPDAFVADHLASEPDPEATLAATPDGVTLGHVHLRVGDLGDAEAFYGDVLGMAVTSRVDGALFLSADGYHHHLGTNTWGSAGTGTRPTTLGLRVVRVHVPDAAALADVRQRFEDAGLDVEGSGDAVTTTDPWGTPVEVSVHA